MSTYTPTTSVDDGCDALAAMLRDVANDGGGALIDHATRTVDELNTETIILAIEGGWRGADAQDFRDIRRLLTVAGGDASADFFHLGADELAIAENLGWVADDAITYLSELAPEGFYVDNDGYAGALVVAPIDED